MTGDGEQLMMLETSYRGCGREMSGKSMNWNCYRKWKTSFLMNEKFIEIYVYVYA